MEKVDSSHSHVTFAGSLLPDINASWADRSLLSSLAKAIGSQQHWVSPGALSKFVVSLLIDDHSWGFSEGNNIGDTLICWKSHYKHTDFAEVKRDMTIGTWHFVALDICFDYCCFLFIQCC